MAGDPGDEERVARTLRIIRFRPLTGVVGMFAPQLVDFRLVPGFHFDAAALRLQTHPRGVGRHGERGHGHEGRNRRAGLDLAVRVGSVPSFLCVGNALFVELGPGLEHVVDAPERPHPFGEVRIKVAVEDRVAHRVVQVAAAAVDDLHRVAGAGDHGLAVQVLAVIAIGRMEPLVRRAGGGRG